PVLAAINQGLHGSISLNDSANPAAEAAVATRGSGVVNYKGAFTAVRRPVKACQVSIIAAPRGRNLQQISPNIICRPIFNRCVHVGPRQVRMSSQFVPLDLV